MTAGSTLTEDCLFAFFKGTLKALSVAGLRVSAGAYRVECIRFWLLLTVSVREHFLNRKDM